MGFNICSIQEKRLVDRDPCNCHLFVWLIGAIIAGALAIWAITSHFHGRTAITIIGGLIISGFVTLILVPLPYSLDHRRKAAQG